MERADCIFLHVPKLTNANRPPGRFTVIHSLPMGLLALADRLHRSGLSTQVVHLGIEWIEDKAFSILSYLRETNPRIVALDLHWHHQSYDVMEMVKQIKAAFPQTYILLGGITASFFHEEIMKTFPEVDGIIRGEAEEPLAELAQAIQEGQIDFFSVPNLTWRRRKKILVNPLSYVATEEDLNRLCFTHFNLLKNYPTYIRSVVRPIMSKMPPKRKTYRSALPNLPSSPFPWAGAVRFSVPGAAVASCPRRRSPGGAR